MKLRVGDIVSIRARVSGAEAGARVCFVVFGEQLTQSAVPLSTVERVREAVIHPGDAVKWKGGDKLEHTGLVCGVTQHEGKSFAWVAPDNGREPATIDIRSLERT